MKCDNAGRSAGVSIVFRTMTVTLLETAHFQPPPKTVELLSLLASGVGIDARLLNSNFCRPRALDECQRRRNLCIGQALLERWHVALISGCIGCRAVLRNLKKHLVGMMPRVPRGIMRRSRQSAIRHSPLPISLAFKRRSVATRTSLRVYALADLDLCNVGWIDTRNSRPIKDEIGYDGHREKKDTNKQPREKMLVLRPTWSRSSRSFWQCSGHFFSVPSLVFFAFFAARCL